MRPNDIFGLIVRTIGLFILLYGVWMFTYGFVQRFGLLPESEHAEARTYLIAGTLWLVIGGLLLRKADGLVRFAYPGNDAAEDLPQD
jgi:hypothetical protein